MPVASIQLRQIDRNPFRDLEGHPLRPEQIEHLKASIDSTEFWGGLLVRPHPIVEGRYQLAFGHARYEAARQIGIEESEFIVRDLDDDAMLRAMADENITQFGRDEYATYREAVYAAIERLLPDKQTVQHMLSRLDPSGHNTQQILAEIEAGGAPGEGVVSAYFNGTMSLRGIRMALKEYRDTGRLAEWHRTHNPRAIAPPEPPKLNAKALSRFEETAHVQAFAETVEKLGVKPEHQAKLAENVLSVLKKPEPEYKAKTERGRKKKEQYARSSQPRAERLTSDNIRSTARKMVAQTRSSKAEREALEAEAHAISIESAMVELSIGMRRAAKAASDIARVAHAIGGLKVDMTPTARMRWADCQKSFRDIEASLREAGGAGFTVELRRLTDA